MISSTLPRFKVSSMLVTFAIAFSFLYTNIAHSQSTAQKLVPVISLLLDSDACIKPLNVGDVVFDTLDPECPSVGRAIDFNGAYATYYSFTHLGGPLHIDLLSDFPNSYDAYIYLRHGEGRDGVLVASDGSTIIGSFDGRDDDDADDKVGARLLYSALPAGRYTIEATAFSDSVAGSFNLSVYGAKVTATATGKLNDTGIKYAADTDTTNSTTCNGTGNFAVQDCNLGKDADSFVGYDGIENDGDGDSGFSFLKVSDVGAPLPASAGAWSCVKDNVTGLMWEKKTDDNGRHDKNYLYTWYNTDSATNGGDAGTRGPAPIGGQTTCTHSLFCDTQAFVESVNANGLCGYNDWRLASLSELSSIVNYQFGSPNVMIDTTFFPNTVNYYWTSTAYANAVDSAFQLSFTSGISSLPSKSIRNRVRLVRSDP